MVLTPPTPASTPLGSLCPLGWALGRQGRGRAPAQTAILSAQHHEGCWRAEAWGCWDIAHPLWGAQRC